jgi:DNA-binding LytR/AlgR family response regulator
MDYSDSQFLKPATILQNDSPINESAQQLVINGQYNEGIYPVPIVDIWWFEIEDRSYHAYTEGRTYRINKTLSELESILDPTKFFRINRSVIVNIKQILNFSYWEHDKYKIKLKDEKTEFIIQRSRLRELKKIFNPL